MVLARLVLITVLGLMVAGAAPRRLEITGSVDVVHAYNFNRPADHANFFPGVGTSAKRDNELSINLAQVDLALAADPVGLHLAMGYGTSLEVVHAAEVRGVATHPDAWRNLVQASIHYQARVGKGLLVEAGVYPSHIGFEALQTKDNWNYSRTGARASAGSSPTPPTRSP